jgi:hypothetical protein
MKSIISFSEFEEKQREIKNKIKPPVERPVCYAGRNKTMR